MKKNEINEWERYLNGEVSAEEKAKIELKLETDPTYKDHLLAFMLMQDSLAVLGHEAAIDTEVNQLGEYYRKKETKYDRQKQVHMLFDALFYKRTKRELWTVLGGAACVLLIVVSILWLPNEPTIVRIKVGNRGAGFYKKDSLIVAFYKRNQLFKNSKPEYEWGGDTLKLYKIDPKEQWEILPLGENDAFMLSSEYKTYKIIKGRSIPTQLQSLP